MTRLTRQHFRLVADKLREWTPAYQNGTRDEWMTWTVAVSAVANAMSETNPAFDRTKFLIACGTHHQDGMPIRYVRKRARKN